MTKQEAFELCGAASAADMARLINMTRQAIGQWPDVLPERLADRVIGLAVRLGRLKVCRPFERRMRDETAPHKAKGPVGETGPSTA